LLCLQYRCEAFTRCWRAPASANIHHHATTAWRWCANLNRHWSGHNIAKHVVPHRFPRTRTFGMSACFPSRHLFVGGSPNTPSDSGAALPAGTALFAVLGRPSNRQPPSFFVVCDLKYYAIARPLESLIAQRFSAGCATSSLHPPCPPDSLDGFSPITVGAPLWRERRGVGCVHLLRIP